MALIERRVEQRVDPRTQISKKDKEYLRLNEKTLFSTLGHAYQSWLNNSPTLDSYPTVFTALEEYARFFTPVHALDRPALLDAVHMHNPTVPDNKSSNQRWEVFMQAFNIFDQPVSRTISRLSVRELSPIARIRSFLSPDPIQFSPVVQKRRGNLAGFYLSTALSILKNETPSLEEMATADILLMRGRTHFENYYKIQWDLNNIGDNEKEYSRQLKANMSDSCQLASLISLATVRWSALRGSMIDCDYGKQIAVPRHTIYSSLLDNHLVNGHTLYPPEKINFSFLRSK